MRPLREIINDHHRGVKDAVDLYVPLLQAARKSNDPLSEAVQLHEVLRHLSRVTKEYADTLKIVITEQMMTDGEYKADCGAYTVSLRKGATRAVVTHPEALQKAAPEIFKPQPPKVSTAELSRLLKFRPIEGAELVEGDPSITIRRKSS